MIALSFHLCSMERPQELRNKASAIRSLLQTHEYSTREIANLVQTRDSYVRQVRMRWRDTLDPRKPARSLARIREQIRTLHAELSELKAVVRASQCSTTLAQNLGPTGLRTKGTVPANRSLGFVPSVQIHGEVV